MEEDIPESFQENHENDSYDELAQGAELEPTKRGRGRPKGAKNKPKVHPSESEDEELPIKKKVIPKKKTKPPPEYEEEEPPKVVMKESKPEYEEEGKQIKSVPKKKSKPPPPDPEEEEPPPKSKKANFILDVEFDEPKRKAPVRIKRPIAAARPLMHLVAEAAQQHVVREKDRRRNFYESFLPL